MQVFQLSTSLRHLLVSSSKAKNLRILRPCLHSPKPACTVPIFPTLNSLSRNYCSIPACVWPADLPPATEWGYGRRGPDTWPSKYPQAGGHNQSPVDIVTSSIQSRSYDVPLSWKYGAGICKTVVNTGCGWRVDVQGSDSELSGGPLSESYELVQFHSHWGNDSTCGSEHTVDGKAYAGELHFVHWNRDKFPSCTEAVPSPSGLTVIAVFLEEGEKNAEVDKLCEALSKIPAKDDRTELPEDLDPVAMYPADHSFWTYSGSLTTPPCYESVTWIVFKNPITVSQEQLDCFRRMKKPCAQEDSFVLKNYRPPQSLNDREIFDCVA